MRKDDSGIRIRGCLAIGGGFGLIAWRVTIMDDSHFSDWKSI